MTTTHNPDFTPNPERGIHIQGVMDQEMVYRLTPRIISLQHQSRKPITVYIDSPGGLVDYKDSILRLLTASNQDFAAPCKVITVAVALAASAAADFLSAGYYSLAYPDSMIMYHGVRVPPDRALTAEETHRLAQRLRAGNESFATQLARDTETRFLFRFISHYSSLPEVRKQYATGAEMSDLAAFLNLLADKVSESAKGVMNRAYLRYERYDKLLSSAVKKWKKGMGKKTFVQLEVDQIKAIVDFEVQQNKKNKSWKFETEGIYRLTDDFFLLNEYLTFFQGERFKGLVLRFGPFLLTPEEEEDAAKTSQSDKDKKLITTVSPRLRPAWSFFMALCHVLQQGDNHLSAKDAFWLGLIDEVIGVQDLPSFRVFTEHAKELAKKGVHEKEKTTDDDAQAADAIDHKPAGTVEAGNESPA